MKRHFLSVILLLALGINGLKGQQPSVSSAALGSSIPQTTATAVSSSSGATSTTAETAEFKRLFSLAQSGDVQSKLALANAYYYGIGTPKNLPVAYKWALEAANQGNALAESTVAWYYDHGVGVPHDDVQALSWTRKAAEDGEVDAQVEMGWRYQMGKGVPVDLTQAVEWYKKAAIQNDDRGKTALGYALFTGRGVRKDLKSGFAYLLSASEKDANARFAVASCYANGVFVERDPTEAYKWCLLAMELDQQAKGLAEMIKSQLSAAQIAQAVKGAATYHGQIKSRNFQTDDLSIAFAGDHAVTVPFEYVLKDILIPVRLANQETDYLIVDTGSDVTVLDDGIAAHLKIDANQYIPMGGTGADIVLSRLASGVEMSLPGLTVSGATLALLPDFGLDQYLGHPVAGILGYDILSRLIITIDYANKKITFQKPGTFKPDTATESIPLSNRGVHPFIQAGIGSETAEKSGWFLMDSGSDDTVTLTKIFQQANPQIKIDQPVKTGAIGLGGISYSLDGKCPQLKLGKIIVINPIATLLSQRQGLWLNLLGGFIGEGILSRFDVTFDSPDGKLFLKPNSKFSDPFTYNAVGMGIKTAKDNYHSFTVFAVTPDSPAASSNFHVGDQIVSVDKVDAATMSLSDLYDVIRKEGIHHLGIIRAGVHQDIDLRIVENIK